MPFRDHWVPVKQITELVEDLEELLAKVQQEAARLEEKERRRGG